VKSLSLSKINSGLLILIVLINGYVILAPVFPALLFDLQSHSSKAQALTTKIHTPEKIISSTSLQPNQVIIPSMLLDQSILEGTVANQYKTLDKGIWRWPSGSTPNLGSNTILIGHRFTYTNPKGVFYFLNKVKIGDDIGVIWANKVYDYKVTSINQVSPNDTAIENPSKQPELTLFTCTPLWLPKDRLVVVADLEGSK
jgi:LPXTG-site transpeptidase (sortase) family protein